MKRCLLVCSLVLVFAILLSSCGAYDMAFSVSDEAAEADSLRMTFDAAPEAAAPADFDDSNDVSFDDWAVADEAELDDRMVAESAPSIVLDTDDAVEVNVIQRNFDDDPVALPIITPDDPSGRRVIYTVNMDLQSDDFVNAINLLVTTVGEMDGFPMDNHIRGRDMRHPERERSATYILRLPTENLAEFIVTIMENYNILELHLMSDDITLMYERDSWQIDDLDELEQRLTDELDNEDLDGSERLDIEAIIAQIQFDLRDLEQWRSALDYDIFYSTINVRLYEAIMPIEETDEDDELVDSDEVDGIAANEETEDRPASLVQGGYNFFLLRRDSFTLHHHYDVVVFWRSSKWHHLPPS